MLRSGSMRVWIASAAVCLILLLIAALVYVRHESTSVSSEIQIPPVDPPPVRSRESIDIQPARTASGEIARNPVKEPGTQTRLIFKGNQGMSTARLQESAASMTRTDQDAYLRELTNRIEGIYMASGYVQAKIKATPDPENPEEVLIEIEEGKPYRWGKVQIQSDGLPADVNVALFHIEKGWPADIAQVGRMLRDHLISSREQGYADCAYVPSYEINQERGEIDLSVEITEGPRYVIREISLDSPAAQSAFAKLKGQFFSPSVYNSLLTQSGLKNVRLEFDAARAEVSILSAAKRP